MLGSMSKAEDAAVQGERDQSHCRSLLATSSCTRATKLNESLVASGIEEGGEDSDDEPIRLVRSKKVRSVDAQERKGREKILLLVESGGNRAGLVRTHSRSFVAWVVQETADGTQSGRDRQLQSALQKNLNCFTLSFEQKMNRSVVADSGSSDDDEPLFSALVKRSASPGGSRASSRSASPLPPQPGSAKRTRARVESSSDDSPASSRANSPTRPAEALAESSDGALEKDDQSVAEDPEKNSQNTTGDQ